MKTYEVSGDVVEVAAPYARESGEAALIGTALFGVAVAKLANAEKGAFQTKGVMSITKLATDVVAIGDKLYWDNTNKRLTTTASTHKFVAVAMEAEAAGTVATILCRLNGVAI